MSFFDSLSHAFKLNRPGLSIRPDLGHGAAAAQATSSWPLSVGQRLAIAFHSAQKESATWVLLLLSCGLALVTAYLVVAGSWHVALGLILALPMLILLSRHPFLIVLVWLALAPFLMTTDTTVERSIYWIIHRALPLLTIGIILLGRVLRIDQRRLPRLGWGELAMAGYLVASIVSVIADSGSPSATAIRLYDRVVIPMCLYLLVRFSAPTEADLRRLLPVLFFLGVSQSIIGLLSWFAPSALPTVWLDKAGTRTTGSLINPTYYSMALVFAGLLLLHAAVRRKPGPVRWLYIGAFVLTLLLDFLSMSRANWLGAGLIIVALLFLYPRFMLKLWFVAVPALIILGSTIFAGQVEWAQQRLNSQQAEQSALDRLPAYLAAYRMFEARPVFGWGYENFDRFDRRYQGQIGNFENDNKDHTAHNLYLITVAEQGLIGLALYLAPLAILLIRSLKALQRNSGLDQGNRQRLIVLWLIILNYIVLASFMNVLVVFGLGLYWLTLGFIANVVDLRPASGEPVAAKTVFSSPPSPRKMLGSP